MFAAHCRKELCILLQRWVDWAETLEFVNVSTLNIWASVIRVMFFLYNNVNRYFKQCVINKIQKKENCLYKKFIYTNFHFANNMKFWATNFNNNNKNTKNQYLSGDKSFFQLTWDWIQSHRFYLWYKLRGRQCDSWWTQSWSIQETSLCKNSTF